MRRPRYQA